ncbi:hypothetical protein BJ875DRAFT_154675 [Amylocarpus encephaloides]|uniref:Zinc finger PHD-type domain-containing protein n=1 Tax=Amylocarpus encephaloides TaxID=45428 RepID=A0A9P8C1Z9_9HELO|nr:hypothetical protein BJ875DRAFT_154675 [Amylocarpus encephaloides]
MFSGVSSRARRSRCYRCLDLEALPGKPLLKCQQCRRLWHPMCCRPKIFNVKQHLGASSSNSYVCSSCVNTVRCEVDGCNEASIQGSSSEKRLCKTHLRVFHRPSQTHEACLRFTTSTGLSDAESVEHKKSRDRSKSKAKTPLEYTPRARKVSVVEKSAFVASNCVEAAVVPGTYVTQSESPGLEKSTGKPPTEYTHPTLYFKKRPSPSEFDEQPRSSTPNAIPTPSRTKVQRIFEAAHQERVTPHMTPKDTKILKQPLGYSHPVHHTNAKPVGSAQSMGALKPPIMRKDPHPLFTGVYSPSIILKARVDALRRPMNNTMSLPHNTTFPSSLMKRTGEEKNMQKIPRSVNGNITGGTNTLQDLKNSSRARQPPPSNEKVSIKEPWVNPFIRAGYIWEPNFKANAVEVKRRLIAANPDSAALDAVLKKAQEEASITQPRKTKKQIWREAHMFHDLDPRLPRTNTKMSDEKLAEKKAILATRPKRKDRGVFGVPFPEYFKAEARAEEKRKEEEAEREKYWWKYAEPEPESGEEDFEIRREQKRFFKEQLEQLNSRGPALNLPGNDDVDDEPLEFILGEGRGQADGDFQAIFH